MRSTMTLGQEGLREKLPIEDIGKHFSCKQHNGGHLLDTEEGEKDRSNVMDI